LAVGGIERPLIVIGCLAGGGCTTLGEGWPFPTGFTARSVGCCSLILFCRGSSRFLTGISAPGRPGLKTELFSSRTTALSRLISSTLMRFTRSGGFLAAGMFLMEGILVSLVGLMTGWPTLTFASLNGFFLTLVGSFPPLMKAAFLTTVTALRTLTFL
jgi:hypothetical protein